MVMGGGLQDFSVSPSPLWAKLVLKLIRTWLGLGSLGRGLDSSVDDEQMIYVYGRHSIIHGSKQVLILH